MLKLLRFEIKKLLGKKYIWLILLALTVYWCYSVGYGLSFNRLIDLDLKAYQESISGPLTQEVYEKILADIDSVQGSGSYVTEEGFSLSEEEAGDLSQKPGRFAENAAADLWLLNSAKQHADYILQEAENREVILQQAQRNLDRLRENNGSAYEIRVNEKIIQLYQNSKELMLTQADSGWWLYFSENNHSLLLLLFLLVVLAPAFSREYETNMFYIVYSSRGGRGKTAMAKLLATVLICMGAALYFEAVNYLCYDYCFYMENWNLPIRNFSSFSTSPFNFTIGQYTFIKLALFMVFAVLAGFIIICLSRLFSKTIPALIFSVIVLGGAFGISYYFTAPWFIVGHLSLEMQHTKGAVKNWLFSCLAHPNLYFNQFDVVNVLGIPVFSFWIAVAIAILSCVILGLAVWFLYTRNISLRLFRRKR